MKIRGNLVDWLLEIDPTTYAFLVMIERGMIVLYLQILCTIYGMLEASFMWYRNFRTDLEKIGFDFNVYEPWIANRKISISNILFCSMWTIYYKAALPQKLTPSLENGK